MIVSEVKENLGKYVIHKPSWSDKEEAFILNAYIYRIDPRNPLRRISELELQDYKTDKCIYIVDIQSVKAKEIPKETTTETKSTMSEKTRLAFQKFKKNLKKEVKA